MIRRFRGTQGSSETQRHWITPQNAVVGCCDSRVAQQRSVERCRCSRDPTFVEGRKRACIGRHKTHSERKKRLFSENISPKNGFKYIFGNLCTVGQKLFWETKLNTKIWKRENCTKQNFFCTTPKFGNAKIVPKKTPFVPPQNLESENCTKQNFFCTSWYKPFFEVAFHNERPISNNKHDCILTQRDGR